jgi:hypothetical protein
MVKLTLRQLLLANVQHGIVQSPAHEKFQTQVVNPFAISEGLALLGAVPLEDEAITEGKTACRVCCRLVAVEHATSQCRLDVANETGLEAIFVLEGADLVLEPCLSLRLRDGCC